MTTLRPRPQNPNQTYCTDPACQRNAVGAGSSRKSGVTMPTTADNDARARKAWATENPAYWKQYRDENRPTPSAIEIYSSRNQNPGHR